MPSFFERITRKKVVNFDSSELNRVLTLVDLTLLGIGSTVGVGFYVLAGNVARSIAGPSVVICFLIAGIASLFAGLCYAEFGARVPKAGSAYIYSYVCVGELVAFVIGWNLLLEYIIGASSVARGYSGYVDELANNVMSEALRKAMPINVSFLSEYPDFLSFGLCVFISGLLAIGIKESSNMNNIFTGLNIIVIVYVIVAAATQADISNWKLTQEDINATCPAEDSNGNRYDWGSGGFAPYGFSGIMRGAATCFFGFVGFDCIATTGEEAINPSRNIPLSISMSLLVVFIAYFGMAATLTLGLAYCLQDPDAPLVVFFEELGWVASKWIVSIGAIFGFSASLIGVLLPLPRIVYAMANDGIIFRFLSQVNQRFKTPLLATILSGILAGVMAMVFDLESLVDMMSIGTLMAYTIVAVSVMLLRYVPESTNDSSSFIASAKGTTRDVKDKGNYSAKEVMRQLLNLDGLKEPTELSGSVASYATLALCLLVAILSLLLVLLQEQLFEGNVGAIIGVAIVFASNVLIVFIISRQPESKKILTFKVPLVPWMPALSSLINVYLMFNLSPDTWIRFAVWMGIGFPIYFFYGMCHSSEENRDRELLFGLDNPSGPKVSNANSLFVIPTINVQLATPGNSAPSTPKEIHCAKNDPPPSPLADEKKDNQIQNHTTLQKMDDNASKNEEDKTIVIQDESIASPVSCDETPPSSKDNEKARDDVQSRKLPPIPIADISVDALQKSEERKDSASSDDSHEPLEKGMVEKQQIAEYEKIVGSNQIDPQYQTIEEVKIQEDEEKLSSKSNSLNTEAIATAKLIEQVTELQPIYAKVNKKDKKLPDPIIITERLTDAKDPLKRYSSAPVITSSLPSSPSPHHSTTSLGSVPSTPLTRRHPTKVLKRNSSFDEIPPSPLDSPLARRIDKFFIIPVQEATVLDSKDGESGNMKGETLTKSTIFYVGSEDSLENMVIYGDAHLSAYSKEAKRMSKKESFVLVDGLDTIRERGESKITVDDIPIDTNVSPQEKMADSIAQNDTRELMVNANNLNTNVIEKFHQASDED